MKKLKMMKDKKNTVISFDMDGTLTDKRFVDIIWEVGLPRLYSEKYGVGLDDAVSLFKREYDRIGNGDIRWYDINYWLDRFKLGIEPKKLFGMYKDVIKIFPDALEVLEELKDKYTLVLSTNATIDLVDVQLEDVKDLFDYIFSSTSHFKMVKKNPEFYLNVLKKISTKPDNFYHVGDNYLFDYKTPKMLGIKAFLLDRDDKYDFIEDNIKVKSLKEFSKRLIF